MSTTLARVVELEAAKLLTLAEGTEPLSGEQIEALEMLCKCARALRTDVAPDAEPDAGDVEADLGLVDKIG